MAYDKLVDSSQLNSDLGDVADAIRAKSGGSSQLAFPSGFISEIGNISTGGGGGASLPSVISKIDGGTFTLASDTQASRYTITHNLGTKPKQIVLWTEDSALLESSEATSERYIMWSSYMLLSWVHNATTTYAGFPFYIYRGTTGTSNNSGSPATATSSVTNSDFLFPSTMFYKSGIEYKWVAFA